MSTEAKEKYTLSEKSKEAKRRYARSEKGRENKKRYYNTGRVESYRHKWTAEEVKRVIDHTIPDDELSLQIHHTVHAIQDMRLKIRERKISYDEISKYWE